MIRSTVYFFANNPEYAAVVFSVVFVIAIIWFNRKQKNDTVISEKKIGNNK